MPPKKPSPNELPLLGTNGSLEAQKQTYQHSRHSLRADACFCRLRSIFLLRGTSHALCGIRDGVQAGLGDLFTALLAPAIAAVFDPLDGRFNLIESVLLASQQTQREFLIEVATAKLCHVGWACWWFCCGPCSGRYLPSGSCRPEVLLAGPEVFLDETSSRCSSFRRAFTKYGSAGVPPVGSDKRPACHRQFQNQYPTVDRYSHVCRRSLVGGFAVRNCQFQDCATNMHTNMVTHCLGCRAITGRDLARILNPVAVRKVRLIRRSHSSEVR